LFELKSSTLQQVLNPFKALIDHDMFSEYIQAALERAEYDTLEDGSYVATVPGLQGVIAVGGTFEECRKDLIEVIEEWIVARLQWGYPIPPIGGHTIESSKEPIAIAD
jgi:predicted RNase H-like HicB family nuclease